MLALLLLGVVMVQSAAMNVTGDVEWQWTRARHATRSVRAGRARHVLHRRDDSTTPRSASVAHRSVDSPSCGPWCVAAFTCVIVLIPGIGIEVNGARRWLPLGITQVQPSELAKWAVVLFLAWWLTHRPVDLDEFFTRFLPTLVPIGAICLLVVIQDFGTAALIGIVRVHDAAGRVA